MRRIKIVNVILLIMIVTAGCVWGAGPYDEVIKELEGFQEQLGTIYTNYTNASDAQKIDACEEMVQVCNTIKERLKRLNEQTGFLPCKFRNDPVNYISTAINTIEAKITSFENMKAKYKCEQFIKAVPPLGVEVDLMVFFLGSDENKVTGLRGLIGVLIGHLKSNNYAFLFSCDNAQL